MGFTKLDSGIVDSSVWAEPLATRVVWITFLAKADRTGFVAASQSGMLRASNVPKDDFISALTTLEAPDSDSRSKEYDGRRIERTPGGWKVLNYEKYRQFSYSESKSALKKRAQRDRKRGHLGDTGGHVPFLGGHSASASASSSASASKRKSVRRGGVVTSPVPPAFEAFWAKYPRKLGKQDALAEWIRITAKETPAILEEALDKYLAVIKRDGTEVRFIKHPTTFLRKDRWRDYLNYEPPAEAEPERKLTPSERIEIWEKDHAR